MATASESSAMNDAIIPSGGIRETMNRASVESLGNIMHEEHCALRHVIFVGAFKVAALIRIILRQQDTSAVTAASCSTSGI